MGVDNIRTLIKFLDQKGRLKGNRAGYRVVDEHGEPISEKFTWKHVYEDFMKDKATYKIFIETAKFELEKLIAKAPTDVTFNSFDIDGELANLNEAA